MTLSKVPCFLKLAYRDIQNSTIVKTHKLTQRNIKEFSILLHNILITSIFHSSYKLFKKLYNIDKDIIKELIDEHHPFILWTNTKEIIDHFDIPCIQQCIDYIDNEEIPIKVEAELIEEFSKDNITLFDI